MLNILIILADKMSINRRFEDITSWSEIWMKASFIEIITEEAAASKRHFFYILSAHIETSGTSVVLMRTIARHGLSNFWFEIKQACPYNLDDCVESRY